MAVNIALVLKDWLGEAGDELPFASESEVMIVRGEAVLQKSGSGGTTMKALDGKPCPMVHVTVKDDEERHGLMPASYLFVTRVADTPQIVEGRARVPSVPNETVLAIAVPEAEHMCAAGSSRAGSMYVITLVSDCRAVAVRRTYTDMLLIDDNLHSLCPRAYASSGEGDGSGGARARLSTASTGLRHASLAHRPRSAATIEARRAALSKYLQAALLPLRPGEAEEEALHQDRATIGAFLLSTLVCIDTNSIMSSLSLQCDSASLRAALQGAFDALICAEEEQEEGEEGGRNGLGEVRGDGVSGGAAAEVQPPSTQTLLPLPSVTLGSTPPRTPQPFGMADLDAFDCLLEKGWAVWRHPVTCTPSSSASPPSIASPVHEGMRACAAWTVSEWDGAGDSTVPLEVVSRAEWSVGDGRHSAIPRGLSTALVGCGLSLRPGDGLMVVLSPGPAMAAAGLTARIEPTSHCVFNITILESCSGAAQSMPSLHYGGGAIGHSTSGLVITPAAPAVTDAQLQLLQTLMRGGGGAGALPAALPPPLPAQGNTRKSAPSVRFPGRQERLLAVATETHAPNTATSSSSSSSADAVFAGAALVDPQPKKVGNKMPTPAEAEAAFRLYLASQGQGEKPLPALARKQAATAAPAADRSISPPAGIPHSSSERSAVVDAGDTGAKQSRFFRFGPSKK